MIKKTLLFFSAVIFLLTNCTYNSQNISAYKIARIINKKKAIVFVDKNISSTIDFTRNKNKYTQTPSLEISDIQSPLTFVNCKFSDSIIAFRIHKNYATKTTFNKTITFINCKFSKYLNFRQSEFKEAVIFVNCTFSGEAHFEGSIFKGIQNEFKESSFEKICNFNSTNFSGNANFMNCVFYSNANFSNARFKEDVNFSACNFQDLTIFQNTLFKGETRFNYTVFDKKTFFINCQFEGNTKFHKIISKQNFRFERNICAKKFDLSSATFYTNFIFKDNHFNHLEFNLKKTNISDSCKTQIKNNYELQEKKIKIK